MRERMPVLPYGTPVTLTASPAWGYRFTKWSGDCASSTTTNCQFWANDNVDASPGFTCSVSVIFCLPLATQTGCRQCLFQTVDSSVTVVGHGYVTVNRTVCKKLCTLPFDRGTLLVLRAYPDKKKTFRGWSHSCGGNKPTCQFRAFTDGFGDPPSIVATFS